jgi:outer membrane lipoprotein LolB
MKKLFPVLVALVLLGGCAIIHKPAPREAGIANPAAWQARQDQLKSLSDWSLQGRVATGQLLGWTGNLSWRERAPRFDVRLSGPLGAGGMHARGTLDRVVIDTSEGEHFVTSKPEALVKKALGWSFPLAPLAHWAKGLPAPGDYQRISVDKQGRLRALTQAGWTVSYLEYTRPEGAPTALPRRIVLDNGETRIRLVVGRWFSLGNSAD